MAACMRCGKPQSRYLLQDTDKPVLDPARPSVRLCADCARFVQRKGPEERGATIRALLQGEAQKKRRARARREAA